jgi:hypothetical protein
MSDKFHVNPATGNPNKCTATKSCPFGGDEKHYFSKEAAHAAFEKDQGAQVHSLTKPSKVLKDLPPIAQNLPSLPDGRSFAQAWAERFQDLAEFKKKNGDTPVRNLIPQPDSLLDEPVNAIRDRGTSLMTKSAYINDGGNNPDGIKGDFVVCVSTRQGGGNRECYCDDYDTHEEYCLSANNDELTAHPNYLSDADNDWDTTYADFYFDAGITHQQAADFEARASSMRKLAADEAILEGAKNGDFTPWGALSGTSANKVQIYKNAKQRLVTHETDATKAQESNAKIESGMKKIYSGKITTAEAAEMGVTQYRQASLVRESQALVVAQKKLDAVLEIQKSAEDLPEDHPLRQWAIGAREERTYQATEKQGRRNVTVTKRYTPKPRLMDDVESEQRGVDNAKRSIEISLTDVSKKKEANDSVIKNYNDAKTSIADVRSEAWGEGWYGDPRELPEIPKDF